MLESPKVKSKKEKISVTENVQQMNSIRAFETLLVSIRNP